MKCALNVSFANRQVFLHRIRSVFEGVFGRSAKDLGMHMMYDVAHNTAKLEEHTIGTEQGTLLVHRKGAARALSPGHSDIPKAYRDTGQPVIIGGSMETGSYSWRVLRMVLRSCFKNSLQVVSINAVCN